MASIAELTTQVVALTDQVQTLTSRVIVAEQNVTMSVARTGGSDSGVFDKKRLYPKELKNNFSFRSWSERFIAWVAMDNDEFARAFSRAGRHLRARSAKLLLQRLWWRRHLRARLPKGSMQNLWWWRILL